MNALALKQAPPDGVMVALYPDRTVAEALAVPDGEPAEAIHVTLAYLGSVDELDADELAALPHVVRGFARMASPLEGEVSGVGRFTATDDEHPFWASIDVPGLEVFREALVARLGAAGFDVSAEHGFTPHMTLAYLDAAAPDPLETVTPHRLRFDDVVLAVAGEGRAFPLGGDEAAVKTPGETIWEAGKGFNAIRQALQAALPRGPGDREQFYVDDVSLNFPTNPDETPEFGLGGSALIVEWDAGKTWYASFERDDATGEVTIAPAAQWVEAEREWVEAGAPELGGPIVGKSARQQIVYGAVLVPGEPDSDGEVLTAEKVEEVAHTWLEEFQLIDRQHAVKAIDAAPVESYIIPEDRTVHVEGRTVELPVGTWIMAAKVRDAAVWREIENGTRRGFSVMGVPRESLAAAAAAVKNGTGFPFKRVTLADVGGGDANGPWVAPFVSIVDRPAVAKARFFALKSEKNENILRRALSALTRMRSGPGDGAPLSEAVAKHLAEMPSLGRLLHSDER